jgi:thioredoxin 1
MINVLSPEQFAMLVESKDAVLFYLSHDECNVCKVLKPKISELINDQFDKIEMFYVDIRKMPEISGQLSVFTVPTLIVYLDGREHIRKSRNIGIGELEQELERPYHLKFDL